MIVIWLLLRFLQNSKAMNWCFKNKTINPPNYEAVGVTELSFSLWASYPSLLSHTHKQVLTTIIIVIAPPAVLNWLPKLIQNRKNLQGSLDI